MAVFPNTGSHWFSSKDYVADRGHGVLPNANVEKEIISSRLNSTEKSQGSSSLISRDGPFYFKIVYGNNNANKFSRLIISIEKKNDSKNIN